MAGNVPTPASDSQPAQHAQPPGEPAGAAEARTPRAPRTLRVTPPGPDATLDRLRQLWIAVLGEEDLAPDADFFDLGGNSLTAVELMSKVRAEFRVEVGVVILFDYSTLGELANQINRRLG
jgi:phthiocerol/phenolphthiocerol synthesis type-I polyketide synthase E